MYVCGTFSEFARSKFCCSITRMSGRKRQSVGATPSSGSLSEHTNLEKPYITSLPGLKVQ